MDSASLTLARRPWLGLSLAIAISLVDLGCARLGWKRQAQEPPMLGRATDTADIYAMGHKPVPTASVTGSTASPTFAVDSEPLEPSLVGEVGMAVRPAQVAPEPTPGGVALQPPTAIDDRSARNLVNPAEGVPNAGLVLASAERRTTGSASPSAASVVAEARAALDAMTTYEVSLHRQESVNGALQPEEDLVVAIRRQPRAVRLTWSDGPNRGREVLYRSDEPDAPMHVKMANPALPRLKLSPESPLVMKNSRHPVTEAGFDSIVEGLENAVRDAEASGIVYSGLKAAEGLDQPSHCLLRKSPTGETWRIYLDPTSHLPALVQANDSTGQLLERYAFRDVRPNLDELATAEAFDAEARWGPQRGLFGRLTRSDTTSTASPPR